MTTKHQTELSAMTYTVKLSVFMLSLLLLSATLGDSPIDKRVLINVEGAG